MKKKAVALKILPGLPGGVAIKMDVRLDDLKAKFEALGEEIDDIVNAADEANRDLNDEELGQIEAIKAKMEPLNKQITARSLRGPAPSAGRRTSPENNGRGKPGATGAGSRVEPQAKNTDPTQGFRSFGEFAQTIHAVNLGSEDGVARMRNVASTYSSESAGPDGGYAVPPEFRTEIWKKVNGEGSLMSRTSNLTTSRNSITIPADETTPWQTDKGVLAYWGSEGGVIPQSKISLEQKNISLNKLVALVPVTEELLEDAPAIDSYLRLKVPEKMQAKINTALIRGNGVGKPLGVLNSGSLITISKETSQDAGTIVHQNIEKMFARLWAPSIGNAVWVANQDILPQLGMMQFLGEAGSGHPIPIYMPNNSISGAPYGTIKGRPVVMVEAASTVGDIGDLMLIDWTQYLTVTKGEQIRTDVSIHLFFDQDIQAFRFIFRMTGQPLWGSTITPENGSNTRSWAVALETRA